MSDDREMRTIANHRFTPESGPFGDPDRCRVQLARFQCPFAEADHNPGPPEQTDFSGRIIREIEENRITVPDTHRKNSGSVIRDFSGRIIREIEENQ